MKANLKYLRIAPRKVRLVADQIRGESLDKAENMLSFTKKRAAKPVLKLLRSAVNNTEKKDNLFVKEITVNEGPKLKRWQPRARGRATEIQKKTSHVKIVLGEK